MVFQIPTEINNTFPSCFARVEIIAKASPTPPRLPSLARAGVGYLLPWLPIKVIPFRH